MSYYLQVLWHRKPLVIITTVVTVVVVALGLLQTQKVYSASTKLRVVSFGINTPDYGTSLYFSQLSNTFITMLKSDMITDEVKTRLDLDSLPKVKVEQISNTELLKITVSSEDPASAASVSNMLATILIEHIQTQYSSGVANIELTIGSRIKEMDAEIESLAKEWVTLDNQMPRDSGLVAATERAIDARVQARSQLVASYNQALVAQATQANTISIVEPAVPPKEPTEPRRVLYLAGAGLVGLLGGLVLVFVAEDLHPRVYSVSYLEELSGFPLVGRIPPLSPRNRLNPLKVDSASKEILRGLRVKVLQTSENSPPRTILVTSPYDGTSGGPIAANLALSLTHTYERVLLVDTHIRKPSLHRLLKLSNEAGLSEILRGEVATNDVLQEGPAPNLDVLSGGQPDNDALEYFASSRFVHLLNELQQSYDIIVLSGSPLIRYADSAILSGWVSDILLVIRMIPSKNVVEMVNRELKDVASKVLGVIVTNDRSANTRI
jgi:succinoglycan biosynthesis transport protein ExoP